MLPPHVADVQLGNLRTVDRPRCGDSSRCCTDRGAGARVPANATAHGTNSNVMRV